MSKKKRQITVLHFKAGLVIIVLLIVALFYFENRIYEGLQKYCTNAK